MKIIHFFARFPNKTQPYNQVLLERLTTFGMLCEVACLVKGKGKSSFKIYDFYHHKFKWLSYVSASIKHRKYFLAFKEESQLNFLPSVKIFGRYAPLIKANPDVVHVHHVQILNKKLIAFLKICDFKTLISFRGSDILVRPFRNQEEKSFLEYALQNTNAAHAVSGNIQEALESFGKPSEYIYTIYRTVEVKEANIPFQKNEDIDHVHITTIGRIHWTKGYVDAIKSLKVLKDNHLSFTYNICGGYDTDIFDELKFWIRRLDLEKHVVFHGHLNNTQINEILGKTDVYLQSSLTEGIPNTLLRVMYYQIPIVTTNAGGIPEVFQETNKRRMVEVGSWSEMGKELLTVLHRNLEFRESSQKVESIDESIEINNYREMYQKIIEL
ncbi:glycosyltransferase family 4 protein [Mesonia ostreae]|uniref:Glycosyltransferase family 4 protein n=1 Tax=Mesonia ostreae TaxID=861110 RepID=A0ABU2KM40_9FLAO|nr:glycosyltransferase family 4 protein [Mesonia ostreae]MDT0295765.1 glycosyltransferase family 4 protein [Mesonia ostreae]